MVNAKIEAHTFYNHTKEENLFFTSYYQAPNEVSHGLFIDFQNQLLRFPSKIKKDNENSESGHSALYDVSKIVKIILHVSRQFEQTTAFI